MSDGRATTSAENGKKGGRPVTAATLRTQAAREYISKQLEDSLAPIVAKAITQSMEGDPKAREWLSQYSWGRPMQILMTADEEGNIAPLTAINVVPIEQPSEQPTEPTGANG